MGKITVDFKTETGTVKPMHAVNNGPANWESRSNSDTYKAAEIPYARNHDANLSEAYGGGHVVDVHAIFTDFSKDENDEASYDFTITDEYIKTTLEAGTKTFYRLGASIEHWVKKYGTVKPPDYHKWARICEHIIMHCNEGWADGYHFDIEYWEIWNEPDLNPDDSKNKLTWSGTAKEFFEFYKTAAVYLKERFPKLKIGGPALAWNEQWADEFLAEMSKSRVPLDFFSWHVYCSEPKQMTGKAERIKKMLIKHGYENAGSILNEWNYIKSWDKNFLDNIRTIKSMKGAAFTAACMSEAQNRGLTDMLMYYDARVDKIYNGMFSSDTMEPLKGYYPFKMFSVLYRLGTQVKAECESGNIYVTAGKGREGCALMITNYSDDKIKEEQIEIELSGLPEGIRTIEYYLLDENNDMSLVRTDKTTDSVIELETGMYSVWLIKIQVSAKSGEIR